MPRYEMQMCLLRREGVASTDNFIYGWKDYNAADFAPGWNELMVHVGYNDEHYLREYKLVASAEFAQRIQDSGVQLKSFHELAQ